MSVLPLALLELLGVAFSSLRFPAALHGSQHRGKRPLGSRPRPAPSTEATDALVAKNGGLERLEGWNEREGQTVAGSRFLSLRLRGPAPRLRPARRWRPGGADSGPRRSARAAVWHEPGLPDLMPRAPGADLGTGRGDGGGGGGGAAKLRTEPTGARGCDGEMRTRPCPFRVVSVLRVNGRRASGPGAEGGQAVGPAVRERPWQRNSGHFRVARQCLTGRFAPPGLPRRERRVRL